MEVKGLACVRCGAIYPPADRFTGCEACRVDDSVANLTPVYDPEDLKRAIGKERFAGRPRTMWRYRDLLPVREQAIVSLDEGGTPLLELARLGERLGLPRLLAKDESRNPTGSFKDRMASVVVSRAIEIGAAVVTIASSGNGGAALAAYAARAGLPCVIFTNASAPLAMMAQMQAYGARVVATERAADRWTLMRHAVEHWGWYPASNYLSPPIGSNPYGVEGYKTFAYELAEDCDWRPPEHVVFPVCYADGLFGATKGFKELADAGLIDDLPRVHAAEVFGSLEAALADGADRIRAMPTTDTVAISIGAPASTYQGLSALRLTGGRARRTTDDELVAMQRRLGECEGLYVEASSVPALVVAARLKQEGVIGADDRVVCILTATGLKDPGVTARASGEVPVVSPSPDDLERALRDTYGLVVAG